MEENAKEVEQDLRQSIDLLQNQLREVRSMLDACSSLMHGCILFQKERQIEQLHYTIGDHERTILKFRETFRNMQVSEFDRWREDSTLVV